MAATKCDSRTIPAQLSGRVEDSDVEDGDVENDVLGAAFCASGRTPDAASGMSEARRLAQTTPSAAAPAARTRRDGVHDGLPTVVGSPDILPTAGRARPAG